MKILHVVMTLRSGGAERMLADVARGEVLAGHDVEVHTLDADTPLGRRLLDAGVVVIDHRGYGHGRFRLMLSLMRLAFGIWVRRSDACIGWLYHGAAIVALCARRSQRRYGSLHHHDPFDSGVRWGTQLVFRTLCLLRYRLTSVVYVATDSATAHVRAGLCTRSEVISGGVDSVHFRPPSPDERLAARLELGLEPRGFAVVHVARVHADKAQWMLLQAFKAYVDNGGSADLILAGSGWVEDNPEVRSWIDGLDMSRIRLCGEIGDPRRVLWAADVFCLSSATEALPVSLVEAMMCGVTPVATRVGACADVIGSSGVVVPPGQTSAMSAALMETCEGRREGEARHESPRELVVERFALDEMLGSYERLLSPA